MRKIAWERWVDFNHETASEINDEDDDLELIPISVRTPLGMFSPYEEMSPNKMFDCWIAYTNFSLNESHRDLLDSVEGIEVLRIMSRYRFFIGIGKLFSLTEVRPRVEIVLGITTDAKIDEISKKIDGKNRWAVFVYDGGKYEVITTDSLEFDEVFDKEFERLKGIQHIDLFTSDNF